MIQIICIAAGAFLVWGAFSIRMRGFERTLIVAMGALLAAAGAQGLLA